MIDLGPLGGALDGPLGGARDTLLGAIPDTIELTILGEYLDGAETEEIIPDGILGGANIAYGRDIPPVTGNL